MAQVGLSNSSVNPMASRPLQSVPRPPVTGPAAAPAQATRDRLEASAVAGAGALARFPLVESAELQALTAQLSQVGPLRSRCESLAAGLPADQRQALDSLQAMLAQPAALQDTLNYLSEDSTLSPAVREYLNQIVHQMSAVLGAAQQGDATALKQALSASAQVGGHTLPARFALQHLQQTLRFDQALQSKAGRELLTQMVNQAFEQGVALLDAGTPQAQIDSLVLTEMQKKLGQQNNGLMASLVRGDIQQSIASLQQRFASNLQVPGFLAALQQAMQDAGLPADKISKLANAEVIGKIPIEDLEKLQQSLSRQLAALPQETASAPLRQALSSTLEQDFSQIISLRTGFQQFRFTMQEHVAELTRDLTHFCSKSGLELPAQLKAHLEENPLGASQELNAWIQARRSSAAGHPEREHTLDGLEQFAMQLFSGAAILDQVEHGDKIDTRLMDQYERFQTFILTKRALIQAFEKGSDKDLKAAILEFGDRFADWQQLSPAEMQQQLFAWLGQQLDPTAVSHLQQQIHNLRSGFEAHNQRVEDAQLAGVELVSPQSMPARQDLDLHALLADQQSRLGELAHRESQFYRHVLETLGEAALRQQLQQDLELVLEPISHSLQSLSPDNHKAELPVPELVKEAPSAGDVPPVPALAELEARLSGRGAQLEKAVEAIKRDLIRTLQDTRQQTQALTAARRLRDQLQQQIFEMHNQRQQEANRHRLESLQVILQWLNQQLQPESLSL